MLFLPNNVIVDSLVLSCVQRVFAIAYVYFLARTPLPPSKSKVRKWYEKALNALDKWATPEPVPAKVK